MILILYVYYKAETQDSAASRSGPLRRLSVKLRFCVGSLSTGLWPFTLTLHCPSHLCSTLPIGIHLRVYQHLLPEPRGLRLHCSSSLSLRRIIGTQRIVHIHVPMQISIMTDSLGTGVTQPERGCAHVSRTDVSVRCTCIQLGVCIGHSKGWGDSPERLQRLSSASLLLAYTMPPSQTHHTRHLQLHWQESLR